MSTPSALQTQIAAVGLTLPDRVAYDAEAREEAIARSLAEIISRATDLLADLRDPDKASWAVQRILQSAGASGPIGSLWEKAVADASRLEAILNYCLVRTVEVAE